MRKLKFNYRKWFYFGKSRTKQIRIEVSGFDQNPYISFEADGQESEITFHIGFIFGIWITFSRFIPNSWFPQRKSSYSGAMLPDERVFKIYWYEWAIWWHFWMPEDEWNSTDPKWRRNSIHFDRLLKGKHKCEWLPLQSEEVLLPFYEGTYRVTVKKKQRIDSWQRWFTRKSISFEVEAGYNENGKWINCPIPHEGKGENSWDCGEDATYSISFGTSHWTKQKDPSCFSAALHFWESCMKTRQRYGGKNWIPERFQKANYQIPLVTVPPNKTH